MAKIMKNCWCVEITLDTPSVKNLTCGIVVHDIREAEVALYFIQKYLPEDRVCLRYLPVPEGNHVLPWSPERFFKLYTEMKTGKIY